MLKRQNLFYNQPSKLPKDSPAKFYLSAKKYTQNAASLSLTHGSYSLHSVYSLPSFFPLLFVIIPFLCSYNLRKTDTKGIEMPWQQMKMIKVDGANKNKPSF